MTSPSMASARRPMPPSHTSPPAPVLYVPAYLVSLLRIVGSAIYPIWKSKVWSTSLSPRRTRPSSTKRPNRPSPPPISALLPASPPPFILIRTLPTTALVATLMRLLSVVLLRMLLRTIPAPTTIPPLILLLSLPLVWTVSMLTVLTTWLSPSPVSALRSPLLPTTWTPKRWIILCAWRNRITILRCPEILMTATLLLAYPTQRSIAIQTMSILIICSTSHLMVLLLMILTLVPDPPELIIPPIPMLLSRCKKILIIDDSFNLLVCGSYPLFC